MPILEELRLHKTAQINISSRRLMADPTKPLLTQDQPAPTPLHPNLELGLRLGMHFHSPRNKDPRPFKHRLGN